MLVVDCQADVVRDPTTRIVAPLRPPEPNAPARLILTFDIDGQSRAMMTPLLRSVAVRDIEATIADLSEHEFAIEATLDMLVSGF